MQILAYNNVVISFFFHIRLQTMFIIAISIVLLMIHQGESAMKATAVLYGDNSMKAYGTLTFDQENANAPVHITGTLRGLNASSAHVCLIINDRKKE
jgi:hypothetical protein